MTPTGSIPRLAGWLVALLLSTAVLLAGCERDHPDDRSEVTPGDLVDTLPETDPDRYHPDAIREGGQLVVVTRNAPTTYYVDRDGLPAGPEHDMAVDFAAHLDVPVRFLQRNSVAEILQALRGGEAHLAAAGLTATEPRDATFLTGPSYQEVEQQVVCRRDVPLPESVEDLLDRRLMVTGATSYQARLRELRDSSFPGLTWVTSDGLATETLLQRVWEGQVDCTVADSTIVAINRRYMPELEVAFTLSNPEPLAWLLPPEAEVLREEVERWHEQASAAGIIDSILARYYAHVEIFDYVDLARFRDHIDSRLPVYEPHFREAGSLHGVDWRLLAAIAYQESHWDPEATSPTGVRGLMMLTQATARELGVENRLDPVQSIHGGARYLADLRSRLPEDIAEPDRTWIALAAYNIGLAHVRDARTLARSLGRDPDSWQVLREVFPLLAEPEYYQNLRFGYARGGAPVQYVSRVRNYEDILARILDEG